MSRQGHIEAAKRIVSSNPPPPKTASSANSGSGSASSSGNGSSRKKGGEGCVEDEDEDIFLKKISKWSARDRSDWKYGKRPSHRNITIGAALSQGALLRQNASDVSALADAEQGLMAMGAYIAEGNQGDHSHAADVTDNMSNVQDCLRIRELSKTKARQDIAKESAKEQEGGGKGRAKGAMFQVDDAPLSPGMYRRIKPFDPDGLESVRRHNAFMQRKAEERSRARESEQRGHSFRALPLPGYVPYAERVAGNYTGEEGEEGEEGEDEAQDSLVEFIAEREQPVDRGQGQGQGQGREPKAPRHKKPPLPVGDEFAAFFITGGDTGPGEASSDSGGDSDSDSESNDDDIDAELAELSNREREMMRECARIACQRDRAATAKAAAAPAAGLGTHQGLGGYHPPDATPRGTGTGAGAGAGTGTGAGAGAGTGTGAAPRGCTPRHTPRRPTSSDVLQRTPSSGGPGPSLLDLDRDEREAVWRQRREERQEEMKREIDIQRAMDLRKSPSVSNAQASWRRAKEEHTRETARQLQHEEMKQKLSDMQVTYHTPY
jgi:hypothetical protein